MPAKIDSAQRGICCSLRLETLATVGRRAARYACAKNAARFRSEKEAAVYVITACLRRFCVVLAFPIAVIFLTGLLSAEAESAKEAPARLQTLTTANAVHSLTSEESRRAYPVHLRAVVTYYDPSYGSESASVFVHDSTGGVYVNLPRDMKSELPPGTLIELQGVSDPGGFAPMVANVQVKVLGRGPLPSNPHRVSLLRIHTGVEDCQWVEVEGVVRSVVERGHNVRLQLQMEGGIVGVVMVKEAGVPYSGLVDAKVRLRATPAPMLNKNSQIISVRLMCPGFSEVKILEPALGDPFQQPVIPIDGLLRWNQVNARYHREHVRGTVTLQWPWPDSLLCIHDAAHAICAHTDQNPHLALGDDVDVVGFMEVSDGTPALYHPLFRKVGSQSNVPVDPVTVEQVLQGKTDSDLIRIDGQLIGYSQSTSDITLLLTSGAKAFTAILPKRLAGPELNPWKIGSRLRITGICSIRLDTGGSAAIEGTAQADSFRILMRSPGDVAVLESPSWWTAGHAFAFLALAIVITLVVFGWVMALRRQVGLQTILLRESEQRFRHMALHDSLTGLATRLLLKDRLTAAVESANRHHTGLTLLMLDLDNFKEINDTFGHRAGDEVLRVTALRLLDAVRKSDTVARMGGDEFIALLHDLSDPQAVEKFAASIVQALSVPVPFEGRVVQVSASIGVCSASAGQLQGEALLKCADAALYHAKASGRNCFHVFTPDITGAKAS